MYNNLCTVHAIYLNSLCLSNVILTPVHTHTVCMHMCVCMHPGGLRTYIYIGAMMLHTCLACSIGIIVVVEDIRCTCGSVSLYCM